MSSRARLAEAAIRRCLRAATNGAHGYAAARGMASEPELARLFEQESAARAELSRALLELARRRAVDLEARPSSREPPAHGFLDGVDAALSGNERDRELVSACMRGDAAALAAFDHALEEAHDASLDEEGLGLLRGHRAAIARSLDVLTERLTRRSAR